MQQGDPLVRFCFPWPFGISVTENERIRPKLSERCFFWLHDYSIITELCKAIEFQIISGAIFCFLFPLVYWDALSSLQFSICILPTMCNWYPVLLPRCSQGGLLLAMQFSIKGNKNITQNVDPLQHQRLKAFQFYSSFLEIWETVSNPHQRITILVDNRKLQPAGTSQAFIKHSQSVSVKAICESAIKLVARLSADN